MQEKTVEEKVVFWKEFEKANAFSVLGIYKRLVSDENDRIIIPSIIKAVSIFNYLNFKFQLYDDNGGKILPENEYQLFEFYQKPLQVFFDKMPDVLVNEILENTSLYYQMPIYEKDGTRNGHMTEDGEEFLGKYEIHKSKNVNNQVREYLGQMVYKYMCDSGCYHELRSFLISQEAVYIPDTPVLRSPKQKKICQMHKELIELCYGKSNSRLLYKCKYCGMVLREYKIGKFSCVSDRCREKIKTF